MAVTQLLTAATSKSQLFSQCACIPESGTVPPIPLFVIRWFTQCLDACVGWRSTDCLASLHNIPLDPDWLFLKFTGDRGTFCGVWEDWTSDGVSSLPSLLGPSWILVTDSNLKKARTHLPTLQPIMSFRWEKIVIFLLASVDSLYIYIYVYALAYTQHRLSFFSKRLGGCLHLPLPCTSRFTPLLCLSLTQMMHDHLSNKKIGAWAQLHQKRYDFLPYQSHPVLRYLRYRSTIGPWRVGVPPPHMLPCMCTCCACM